MWARGGLGLGFTISGLSVSSGPDAARAFRLRLPGVVVLRGGEWNRGGGGMVIHGLPYPGSGTTLRSATRPKQFGWEGAGCVPGVYQITVS